MLKIQTAHRYNGGCHFAFGETDSLRHVLIVGANGG